MSLHKILGIKKRPSREWYVRLHADEVALGSYKGKDDIETFIKKVNTGEYAREDMRLRSFTHHHSESGTEFMSFKKIKQLNNQFNINQ